MPTAYSTYDAKARFSEILRKVRAGESVYVTYRGEPVAEIRPIPKQKSLEERLEELQREGWIGEPARRLGSLETVARRPGALERFLQEREG